MSWHGRALEVNLTSGRSQVLPLSSNVLHQTLGGRGLAGYLLATRSSDPSTPIICLACGPFSGHDIPTAERLVAVFRSPLTTGIFDNSSGCSFAASLKQTGFDALLLTGSASRLSQLQIDSSGARLLSATALAGLDTGQTLEQLENAAALVIGPAGENRVRFASVVASAGEPLARGGLGALFGEMKLKALSVVEQDKRDVLPESPAYSTAKADIQRLYNASPFLCGPLGIGACGTAALLDLTQARQMLPTANFTRSSFERAADFSSAQLRKRPGYRDNPCPGCSLACRKQDASGSLPEYDSLAHFSALLGGQDLPAVISGDQLCRAVGLDPVSTAALLAAYFTSQNKRPETEDVLTLIRQIAFRRGAGEDLAKGLRVFAQKVELSHLNTCVKGLELPAFDPRGAYGMALSLAVSTGGEYRHAQAHFHELLRKPVPTERFSFAGKARIILQAEDATAACDSLSVCRHTLIAAGLEEYSALLTAVTGINYDTARLAEVGRQTVVRERWLNQQYGFGAADDILPIRFFDESGNEPGNLLQSLELQSFITERDRYYQLRGLNEHGELPGPPEELL